MIKFNKLPEHVKTKLLFNQWIMWSDNIAFNNEDCDFGFDYYNSYRDFRFHCVDLICAYGLLYSDIPEITKANQNEIFKKCRSQLDLNLYRGDYD